MYKGCYEIVENTPVARAVYRMRLLGDTTALTAPGQFVNIQLPGFYLRRPISVANWDSEGMVLLYKVVGQGTEAMSRMAAGEQLDLLVGLGNGFDASKGDKPLLIGGGVGTPPLLGLAKALLGRGVMPQVALGFATHEDRLLVKDFEAMCCQVSVALISENRLVTDLFPELIPLCDYYYACGPEPMLRAVHQAIPLNGQLSFEARMACGFGACMGCTCKTFAGGKRICTEGPVLFKEEIIWET